MPATVLAIAAVVSLVTQSLFNLALTGIFFKILLEGGECFTPIYSNARVACLLNFLAVIILTTVSLVCILIE